MSYICNRNQKIKTMNTGSENFFIIKHTIRTMMMYCCMPEIEHCGD
ncbi:hypothetical protein [Chryseobacterium profundimaris]|nr:hypothetical protein [Chryseobacterium profundimaris]